MYVNVMKGVCVCVYVCGGFHLHVNSQMYQPTAAGMTESILGLPELLHHCERESEVEERN